MTPTRLSPDAQTLAHIAQHAPVIISHGLLNVKQKLVPCQDAILRLFDLDSKDAEHVVRLWKKREQLYTSIITPRLPKSKADIRSHTLSASLGESSTLGEEIQKVERLLAQLLLGKTSYDSELGLPSIREVYALNMKHAPERKYVQRVMGEIDDHTLQKLVDEDIRIGDIKPDPEAYKLLAQFVFSYTLGYKPEKISTLLEQVSKYYVPTLLMSGEIIDNGADLQDTIKHITEELTRKISHDLSQYMAEFYIKHLERLEKQEN